MVFSSPIFLWAFLPVLLVAVWVFPKRARNLIVSIASLVFYAWGAHEFVLLLLACMAVNFAAGQAIDSEALHQNPRRRKLVLIATVAFDLSILAVWKYGTFSLSQIADVRQALGSNVGDVLQIALPIGISFFTFHHISYIVDVYRGVRGAQKKPLEFVTYIAMFPQLVAGPIVRYNEIADQLPNDAPRNRWDDFTAGLPRFMWGLFKKVVIADAIAPIADASFQLDPSNMTTGAAWIGALAYTLQIYFDFSGYSDMAIGLGRMIGFRLPENFRRPYSAISITDFWRRWHISLSNWFRDYLYVPLGGNRKGNGRTYVNLSLVFLLTGLWHGANWTFIVWGAYHGGWLLIERATGLRTLPAQRWTVLRRAATFLIVLVGWVLFRAPDLSTAGSMLGHMFWPHGGALPPEVAVALNHQSTLIVILAALVVFLPGGFVMGRYLQFSQGRIPSFARGLSTAVVGPYAAMLVAAGTFSPFLYFQF
jgi:alginate O-acetyltransferase complex protein AlgI